MAHAIAAVRALKSSLLATAAGKGGLRFAQIKTILWRSCSKPHHAQAERVAKNLEADVRGFGNKTTTGVVGIAWLFPALDAAGYSSARPAEPESYKRVLEYVSRYGIR